MLCLEWSNSHSRSGPEVDCDVGSSHLKTPCPSSPGVSTAQPAIQLPGCLICSGNLDSLRNWGLDTLGTAQRPKQRHLPSFRMLRTAKKSAQWSGRGVMETSTLLMHQGVAVSIHHLFVSYTVGIHDAVNSKEAKGTDWKGTLQDSTFLRPRKLSGCLLAGCLLFASSRLEYLVI